MTPPVARTRPWRQIAVGVAALAPFVCLLIYLALTAAPRPRDAPTPAAAAAADAAGMLARMQPPPPPGHAPADLDHMLADLRGALARNPGDVDGWVLLGRTLAANRRWQDATEAFSQAVAQRPDDPTLHLQLGEVLTLAAQGEVSPAATAQFAYAPDDPRARYYGAVALAQAGKPDAARQQLDALRAAAPPDAPWLDLVRHELLALAPSADPRPDARMQPSPAATRNLEARVAADPADAESWLALATSYQDSGDRARALASLARANDRIHGNVDLLLAYGQLLATDMRDDTLSPVFVTVMQQVEAVDPDQPDALWYLGLAAAAKGDTPGAARRWHRLLDRLPPGSDEHDAVAKRLSMLSEKR